MRVLIFSMAMMIITLFLEITVNPSSDKNLLGFDFIANALFLLFFLPPLTFALSSPIFYVYAWIKMLNTEAKTPSVAVLFVVITALFNLMFISGKELAWGWGFITWLTAIITLTAYAMLRHITESSSHRHLLNSMIIIVPTVIIFTSVFLMRYQQYQKANIQEREFFSKNVAVLMKPSELSGIPYIPLPDTIHITPTTNIEILPSYPRQTWDEMSDLFVFSFDKPSIFIYQGKKYHYIGGGYLMTDAPKQIDYYIKVKKESTRRYIEILDADKQPLWQANINKEKKHPRYNQELIALFQPLNNYEKRTKVAEELTQTCDIQYLPHDKKYYGTKLPIQWQGKKILAYSFYFKYVRQSFCGEAINVTVGIEPNEYTYLDSSTDIVAVYSKSLQRRKGFQDWDKENPEQVAIVKKILEHLQTNDNLNEIVTAVDVTVNYDDNDTAIVKTIYGELRLH